MLLSFAIVVLAGAFSVLTPCILPLLPALLVVSQGEGRGRPWGIVVGVVATFCATILLATWLVDLLELPADTLRWLAATMLLVFGLVLLVPALDDRFQRLAQHLVRRAPARAGDDGSGFGSGVLAGSTLGFVWAPCAGPILAGVTSAVAREGVGRDAVVLTLGYGLGMVLPLALVVVLGRGVVDSLRRRLAGGRRASQVMGVVLVATSALFFTGLDTTVNRAIAENLDLTSTPIADLEAGALDRLQGIERDDAPTGCDDAERLVADERALEQVGYPQAAELCDLGEAPAIGPGDAWINTPGDEPLTRDDLRGDVVLVDVWTYSCINCLRTLPHLRDWHRRYAGDGLRIVGVHAPEFEFEKDEGNVRDAVDDLDVAWPVVLDNEYETWNRFHNRYWPAKYLVDREGRLRWAHYGEGRYEEAERHIRELLGDGAGRVGEDERAVGAAPGGDDVPAEPGGAPGLPNLARTPETYLGHGRAERFAGSSAARGGGSFVHDADHPYAAPQRLGRSEWALGGTWRVEDERSVAVRGAELVIRSEAADVFLVVGPAADGDARSAGSAARGLVVHDGAGTPPRTVAIDGHRLYVLREGDRQVDRTTRIEVPAGLAVYAFTFG